MSIGEKTIAGPLHAADRLDARAVLIPVACCACWGVNQVAIRVANEGISPMLQVLGEAFPPSLAAVLAPVAFGVYLVNRPQRTNRA